MEGATRATARMRPSPLARPRAPWHVSAIAGAMCVNPCVSCGACCAGFRASFYWAETTDGGGTVPAELTVPISPFLVATRGTEHHPPRCDALCGEIGASVSCAIYRLRSSTCREFRAAWVDGAPAPDCDRARALHRLPPVHPADVIELPAPEPEPVPPPRRPVRRRRVRLSVGR